MSKHKVKLKWEKTSENFNIKEYNRDHIWDFENGQVVKVSASPAFFGNPDCVDPEQGLVASLSSCHMLTFLAVCSKKKITVESYEDNSVGILGKNEKGKFAVTKVILKPQIKFAPNVSLSKEDLDELHKLAHRNCIIANSVETKVIIEEN